MVNTRLEFWWGSETGLVRKSNQDAVGYFPELGLFIVADGMGGHAAGDVASRMAIDVIAEFLRRTDGRPAQREARGLCAAIELANERIFAAGTEDRSEDQTAGMGSTVVVLLIDVEARRACWAHVGDSRLYRTRGGTLELLTADHTIFGDKFAGQSAIPLDLRHTNILLQALGTNRDVMVPTGSDVVQCGDTFLLCSDGISGLVDASVLRSTLTSAEPLEETGRRLLRSALEAGGRDNATAVLVRVVDT